MNLAETLESFNRKERFFLVASATDATGLTLGATFRASLGKVFQVTVEEGAFAATDYHLDWLQVALLLASNSVCTGKAYPDPDPDPEHRVVSGNQEDIDLLIASEQSGETHLFLLEAKAGSSFSNRRLQSKATRLRGIFGEDGGRFDGVVPHFALVSPTEPRRVKTSDRPHWMAPRVEPTWISLPTPSHRHRVTQCDLHGQPAAGGGHFLIFRDPWKAP